MARIRSIKPEFCTSEQVADCSTTARLLFVLMWMHCDDQGVHPASTKRLKMECFPADPFTDDQMREWVGELLSAGLLREFSTGDGTAYWHVTGWKHQKIEKPNHRYPAPPSSTDQAPEIRGAVGDSSTTQGADRSGTSRRPVDDSSPPEGSRVESKGEEGRESGAQRASRSPNGSRLPADWSLPDEWGEWAASDGGMSGDDIRREAAKFGDFWRAKAGKDGRKVDWFATWRNWCRRAMEGRPGASVHPLRRDEPDGPRRPVVGGGA